VEGDIAITCERCGAQWMRGEARCKRCGRAGGVSAPQRMTRQPRGTLLAVVGMRQVPLCRSCDADALDDALSRNQPIPEGYVSRFLFGEFTTTPEPAAPVSPRPETRSRPRLADTKVAPTPSMPEAPELIDPTVRQATEAYLESAGSSADALTMVLLGTNLGPSTRLSRLDTPATASELARWVDQTYGGRREQRDLAVATLCRAFGYWQERGWLTTDPAVGLK